MKTEIKITNEASVCTIDIEGVIGVPEESQFTNTSQSVATYDKFREELSKIRDIDADEVVVNIRSTGGDVNDALLIYESLSLLRAKVTTRCYGYTASAATIIAQAASEGCREISSAALYLIHMSSSTVEGNSSDLAERIDLLKKTDDRIATLYAMRSGHAKGEFEKLMSENGGRGRWLAPNEVVELGLADSIIGGEEVTKPAKLVDRVKGWFSSTKRDEEREMPNDINILHLPTNGQIPTSAIALQEGQCRVVQTKIISKEDPSLDGTFVSHNTLAYAEDARNLNFRIR